MRAARRLSPFAPLVALSLGGCVTVVAAPTHWTAASSDPGVVNLTPASFAPGSGVTDAVLAECGLDREIPQRIARWSPVPVNLTENPAGGARVLNVSVHHILAPGGGPWTGPKSMTIHGELVEPRDGAWQVVASFDARRTTTRGGGTCDMLLIITDVLAKDVRPWLAQPTLNAPLGEL